MSAWISVKERLPLTGCVVLAIVDRLGTPYELLRYNNFWDKWCDPDQDGWQSGVTHWQPLPEPPEDS